MNTDTTGLLRLRTLLGEYPHTVALKNGSVRSAEVELDFADVKSPSAAFKRVVRELEFDIAELAIVTFLLAKAHGKPLVLMPAVMFSRYQHPYLVYNAERGVVAPADLAGRRIGVRSYSVTTVTWLRGILADDYGVDLERVRWVTFEEPHVAEFRDPPNVERAPAGKDPARMLFDGELDAAILAPPPLDARLRTVIPDPATAAQRWHEGHGAQQINHMVVVKSALTQAHPEAVREAWRMLIESRKAASFANESERAAVPYGVAANRRNLEVAIDYVFRQRLIPRRYEVDELFDDVTRGLS